MPEIHHILACGYSTNKTCTFHELGQNWIQARRMPSDAVGSEFTPKDVLLVQLSKDGFDSLCWT